MDDKYWLDHRYIKIPLERFSNWMGRVMEESEYYDRSICPVNNFLNSFSEDYFMETECISIYNNYECYIRDHSLKFQFPAPKFLKKIAKIYDEEFNHENQNSFVKEDLVRIFNLSTT